VAGHDAHGVFDDRAKDAVVEPWLTARASRVAAGAAAAGAISLLAMKLRRSRAA
jgi:hypothetical protein